MSVVIAPHSDLVHDKVSEFLADSRKAYAMVKGAMEHPELMRTIDSPMVKGTSFK